MDNEKNNQINDVTAPNADNGTRIDVTLRNSAPAEPSAPSPSLEPTTPVNASPSPAPAEPSTISAPSTPEVSLDSNVDNSPITPEMPSVVTGSPKKKGSIIRLLLEVVLVLALVGLSAYTVMLSSDKQKLNDKVNSLQSKAAELDKNVPAVKEYNEAQLYISKVGKLVKLPTGEKPTVIKVTDPAAAKKNQPFFNESQAGDIALVYVNNNVIYLYRPSTNKIIGETKVNLMSGSSTAAPASTTPATPAQ